MNHYAVLGLQRNAKPAEIKRAYQKLRAGAHPDKCPNDPTAQDRFEAIQKAYDVLSDPMQRRAYVAALRSAVAIDPEAVAKEHLRLIFNTVRKG